METIPRIENVLKAVRAASPLIHHLTNFVTMNDCANATLAIGASPVMSAAEAEAPQLAAFSSALLINMGTPDEAQARAMLAAAQAAARKGIPLVFDPVGAGATAYRRELSARLLRECRPAIVKGNAAEIAFLAGIESAQRGVDSIEPAGDVEGRARAALALARRSGCVVLSSGETDIVANAESAWAVSGGRVELGSVCGSGCMLGSVSAALAAVCGKEGLFGTALAASLCFKLASESAASSGARGLSSFRWAFMDALSLLRDEDLDAACLPGQCERRFRHVGA
jgi:hydroxyethylthiazole kinase